MDGRASLQVKVKARRGIRGRIDPLDAMGILTFAAGTPLNQFAIARLTKHIIVAGARTKMFPARTERRSRTDLDRRSHAGRPTTMVLSFDWPPRQGIGRCPGDRCVRALLEDFPFDQHAARQRHVYNFRSRGFLPRNESNLTKEIGSMIGRIGPYDESMSRVGADSITPVFIGAAGGQSFRHISAERTRSSSGRGVPARPYLHTSQCR